MLDTYYFANYPSLRDEQTNIDTLMTFALRLNTAIVDYNESRFDRIDISMDEVEVNILQCRATCEVLGMADRVPFDVLVELRSILATLYAVRVLNRQSGRNVIGIPTAIQASEGAGV